MKTLHHLTLPLLLASCAAASAISPSDLSEVFVKDFSTSDPAACTTADVALNHAEALAFFRRATPLSYRQMQDNYPVAPCRIEGTLKHRGRLCEWEITAAATGVIRCDGREQHFACDGCEDLFQP